jgi:hypothetical protein
MTMKKGAAFSLGLLLLATAGAGAQTVATAKKSAATRKQLSVPDTAAAE